jgi:hypothetical protein
MTKKGRWRKGKGVVKNEDIDMKWYKELFVSLPVLRR